MLDYKTPLNPAKGRILISEPFLNDPNFKRTIILLTEHDEEGSVGFVLNRPVNLTFNETLDDFPELDSQIFFGGPVQINTMQFIYRGDYNIEGSYEIISGLHWGGSFELLKILIESNQIDAKDFKFFIGYSGWSEGQLEEELKINSWLVAETSIEKIFTEEPDNLWRDVLKDMGKKYAVIASFPEDPSVN